MAYNFSKNAHAVYALSYHMVQCIKYRKKVFYNDEIINFLKERTLSIANRYGIKIQAIETDMDHVHILFESKPQIDILKFINNWKSATSKSIRNRFRNDIKNKLYNNKFWSDSYCLITTGQVTLDMVKKYVENQGK